MIHHKTMEDFSQKKIERLDRKKKKMLALLQVAKLNNLDRAAKQNNKANKLSELISNEEPEYKKLKIEQFEIINEIMPKNKTKLDDDELKQLKQQLRERKQKLQRVPRFRLKTVGEDALLDKPAEERIPLFLSDVQHLLLFALLGNHSPYTPQRWSHIERYSKISHTVVLVIENLSLYNYISNESKFENLNSIFETKLELVTPSVYKGDLVEEIAAVPLTSTQKDKLIREYGNLKEALKSSKVFSMLKAVFPVQERVKHLEEKQMELGNGDKYPRTHLLLSAWQMVEENYPIPLKGSLSNKYAKYKLTKDTYLEVNPNSPMFGLDCEMCRTTTGELELTRISVVNEKHEIIYEKLVKPYNRIVDYLTKFSGITKDMLANVTTRLEHVQEDLRKLLPPDAIIVGQSLNSDLHAMRMMHPYVIDTSVIFNLSGDRTRKTKLQVLAREFLDEEIQDSKKGHCSVEDSLSSIKLVQLKLRHSIEFGDAVLSGQKGVLRNYRTIDSYYGSSMLHHITKIDKKAIVFSSEEIITKYMNYVHQSEEKSRIICISQNSNKSIVKSVTQRSMEHDLSIAHCKLTDDSFDENIILANCQMVDKWIKKLWNNLANSGMFVCIFGGQSGQNGACFIQIKKPNSM